MKLAQKLTLFLVIGMCLVLALDFWIGVRRELDLHAADMRRDQHVTGQALGAAFAELWRTAGRERAQALVERTNRVAGQSLIRWISLDASPSRLGPQLPSSDVAALRQGREVQRASGSGGSERFFTYVPVRTDGVVSGAIEISESLAENRRYVRLMLYHQLATAGVLIGLSGLIAILLGAAFVGRPIRILVDKTRRIAAGDLAQPLDLHQHDEIGELAREIDAMCLKLDAAQHRIEAETSARIDAIERLRHADRLATVGRLASGVAHELGTPLNVASQRAKMIATGEVTGAEAADGARIVAEQTQRMTAIIRQLLDFARRQKPDKTRHDLRLVARQIVRLLAALAARRDVTLRIDEGGDAVFANVDAGQIQQAVANLVMNGIQAMESGGEVTITTGTRIVHPPADLGGTDTRFAFIEVRDQGSGIPPESLPHVFEPFFTTKEPGEGTGLGLAVAYGIVRDHGGWVELDSTPGVGSRFSIYLPIAEPAFAGLVEPDARGRDEAGSEIASATRPAAAREIL
jgi:two-component system, NtrC family, sensor kinase